MSNIDDIVLCSLKFMSQDVRRHLEEVAASEAQVNELNRQLSTQMSEMVRDFDEDKRQALEKWVSIHSMQAQRTPRVPVDSWSDNILGFSSVCIGVKRLVWS